MASTPLNEKVDKITHNTPLQQQDAMDDDKDENSPLEIEEPVVSQKESRPSFQETLFEKAEDFEDEDEDQVTEFHICQCCYNLNPWLSFSLYASLGSAILLTPFIVGVTYGKVNPATLFYVDPANNALSPPDPNGFPISPISQAMRWSLFFTFTWLSLLVTWRLISVIPYYVTSLIIVLFKSCNENVRTALEYIVVLRGWTCFALCMIWSFIFYQVMFSQMYFRDEKNPFYSSVIAVTSSWLVISQIISVVMVLSFCVFAQKFFLHSVAVNFHSTAYADRIATSKKTIKTIDKLRKSIKIFEFSDFDVLIEKSPMTSSGWLNYRKPKEKPNPIVKESTHIDIELKPRNTVVSKQETKKEVLERSKTKKEVQTLARTQTRKGIMDVLSKYNTKISAKMDISNDKQARKLGKEIFIAIHGSKQGEIHPGDFLKYFSDPDDAKEAFTIFDTDKNQSLTMDEMKSVVAAAYRERRALFRSLKGLANSLKSLDHFFYSISIFVTAMIALPIFGISLNAILPFTSLILALSFIFGSSAKNVFECLIFLFAAHPYDAGDRVVIDGQTMIVETVNLLTTIFTRGDGQSVCAPNATLATKSINNLRRSGNQSENIDIYIDIYTSEEKIRLLRERLRAYVISLPRDFSEACDLNVVDIESMNKLKCSITLKYRGNWQEMWRKAQRRNEFMYALLRNLIELKIVCYDPPQISVQDRNALAVESFNRLAAKEATI